MPKHVYQPPLWQENMLLLTLKVNGVQLVALIALFLHHHYQSSSLIITTSSSVNSISEFVSDSEDTGDSIGSSGWKSASDSVECVAPETVSSLSVCHVPGPLRVASPRCRCLWASTNAVCNHHYGCDLAPLALAHPGLCSVPQLWGIQSATLTCLVAVEMKGHHDTWGD